MFGRYDTMVLFLLKLSNHQVILGITKLLGVTLHVTYNTGKYQLIICSN